MCSYLVVQLLLGLARNIIVLENPQWRLSIYHCSIAISNAVWIGYFIESLNLGITNRLVNVFCNNKYVIFLIKVEHIVLNVFTH
jgi:hypothetical protein